MCLPDCLAIYETIVPLGVAVELATAPESQKQ